MAHPPSGTRIPPIQWIIVLIVVVAVGCLTYIQAHQHLGSSFTGLGGCMSSVATADCDVVVKEAAVKQDPRPYRFAALGDWGAGTPFQRDVAAQMINTSRKQPFQTVLMLGDNIYPDGNIKKWGDAYFTRIYGPLEKAGVHFVVALGNHDVLKDYQKDQIRFFRMPGSYYTVLPAESSVQYFVIDSNSFARDKAQQQWLEKRLSGSKAPCKIVLGHHPIHSSGVHGSSSGLKKTLEPLLIRHRVTLYLAGHDHNYERFTPIQGVGYMVSGGGGAYLRNFEKVQPGSAVRQKRHHFLLFELREASLYMQAIDKSGQVFDTATWPIPRAEKPLSKAS
jgi:hypothetical protein